MEPILFFLVMILLGSVAYFVLCILYFAVTARPAMLAFKLCWKMSVGTLLGFIAAGVGAVLIPAVLFNGAVEPLPNYSKWRDIGVAFLFSAIVAAIMFFSAFGIAWEIFE